MPVRTGRHDNRDSDLSPDNALTSSLTAPTPMFCLDDFTCALQRDYLWQGTLFVTLTHLCFFGRHFTKTIHIKIHFADLVSIDKEKKLGMIPNTLRIRVRTVCQSGTTNQSSEMAEQDATVTLLQETTLPPPDSPCAEPTKEYVLTSFLSRDQAFAAIERHWNIHKQLQVHQRALLARHRRSIDQLRLRQEQSHELGRHQEQDSGTWSSSSSSEEDGDSMSSQVQTVPAASREPMVDEDKGLEHVHDQDRSCSTPSHAFSEPRVGSECLVKFEHAQRLHASASNSSLRARRKAQRTYSVITSEATSPSSERMDESEDSDSDCDDDDDEMDYGNPLEAAVRRFHADDQSSDPIVSKASESDKEDGLGPESVHPPTADAQSQGLVSEPYVHQDTPMLVVQELEPLVFAETGMNSSLLAPPKRTNSTSSTSSNPPTLASTTPSSRQRNRVTSISSSASITSDRSPRLIGPPKLISPSLTTTKVSHSSSTIQSTAKEGEPQNMTIHRREGTQGALLLEDETYLASSYASSTISMRSGGLSHPRYQHGTTTATTTTTTVETRGVPWAGSQISLVSTISNSSLESLTSTMPSRHHVSDVSRMPDLEETEEVLMDEEVHIEDDCAGDVSMGEEVTEDESHDIDDDDSMEEPEVPCPIGPVDCGCSRHYKNMVLSRVVPLSLAMCFEILFSAQGEGEGDRLASDVHRVKDGSTDFKIQPWSHATLEEEASGHDWENKSRDLEYSVSFKVPMLAKTSTACYEVQKILKHTPDMILVHSESRTPNVPYGEHFSTVNQICLTFEAKSQTRIKMFTEVKFKKSLMWSGRVEAGALEGSGGFWKALIEQLDELAKDPVFLTRQERMKLAAAEKRRQERAATAAAAAEARRQRKEEALAKAVASNTDKDRQAPLPATKKRTRFQTPLPSNPLSDLHHDSHEQPSTATLHPPNAALSSNVPLGVSTASSRIESPQPTMPVIAPGGLLATLAAAAAANAAAHPAIAEQGSAAAGGTTVRSLLSLQHLRQLQQQQQLQQIAQQNYKATVLTNGGVGGRASFDSSGSSDSSDSQTSSVGSLSAGRKRIAATSTTSAALRRSASQEQQQSRSSAAMIGAGGFAAATAFFSLGRSSTRNPSPSPSPSPFLGLPTSSSTSASSSSSSASPQPSPSLPPAATAAATETVVMGALAEHRQKGSSSSPSSSSSSSAMSAASALLKQHQQQCMEAAKEAGGSSSSLSTLASTSSSTSTSTSSSSTTTSTSTTATSTNSVSTLLTPLSSSEDIMTKLQSTWNGWVADVVRIGSQFSITNQKSSSSGSGVTAAVSETDGVAVATANSTGSGQGEAAATTTTLLGAGVNGTGEADKAMSSLMSSQGMETASEDSSDEINDADSMSADFEEEEGEVIPVAENGLLASSTMTEAGYAVAGRSAGGTADTAHRAMSSVLFLSVIVALLVSALNIIKLMAVVSSMVQVVEVRHQWMVAHPPPLWHSHHQQQQQQQQQQYFHTSAGRASQEATAGGAGGIPPFQAPRGAAPLKRHQHVHHHHHHYYHGQDGSIVIKRENPHHSTLDMITDEPDVPDAPPPAAASVSPSPLLSPLSSSADKTSASASASASASVVKQRDENLHEIQALTKALRLEMEILKRQLEEGLV
ncbi:Protein Aster-C [Actinomortierella ambigua]|nr:Protein Aster-C [Actinomortierella ambigua]